MQNHTFPPSCCFDNGNGTATEPCTEEKAKDKIVEVWYGRLGAALMASKR